MLAAGFKEVMPWPDVYLGVDPVMLASSIVMRLQTVVSREVVAIVVAACAWLGRRS
ncbi:hypothetical protein [Pseudoglutamicibacter cumminsii]|uniref:hypothetical protein n=1 Tax=Pseudoglutamicibacter cumminsii TaxID=156979 RepID=UPI0026F251CC|nr:hypothetical protein [Pseudoglutamicibacter cumminsii]